ncbi:phytanoyl-CoA dioxygenase family protein [Streptomyces sp. NPDC018045]|uniref:phytanoyl-CoA dioxygenase family protein n=1 Tax=Streptomyces sp. NPDC018045 TaxID=3365037 RepID=UPI00379A2B4E
MTNSAPATAKLPRVSGSAPVEDILAPCHRDGGVIVEELFSSDQVERFNHEIEPSLRNICPGGQHQDEFAAEFHGKNTKRITDLVTRSETFRREIIDHDLVHALADAVFLEESGSYWTTTAQVIEIGPGNAAQQLHRDLENSFPFVGMGPAGPEVTINFLIALTDFTEENGATRAIPGSNHWENFEDHGTPEQTVPARMRAGDALFLSGKTAHGGGANHTTDTYRRALSFSLNPGYLVGEEAFPFLIDLEPAKSLPPRVRSLVGFRPQYPKGTPGLWQVDSGELADHLGL